MLTEPIVPGNYLQLVVIKILTFSFSCNSFSNYLQDYFSACMTGLTELLCFSCLRERQNLFDERLDYFFIGQFRNLGKLLPVGLHEYIRLAHLVVLGFGFGRRLDNTASVIDKGGDE